MLPSVVDLQWLVVMQSLGFDAENDIEIEIFFGNIKTLLEDFPRMLRPSDVSTFPIMGPAIAVLSRCAGYGAEGAKALDQMARYALDRYNDIEKYLDDDPDNLQQNMARQSFLCASTMNQRPS